MKLIISLLIVCLIGLVGCEGIEEITPHEIPVVEILDDYPDRLEECKKQLGEEIKDFEYEFECNEWELTGENLFKEMHCREYKFCESDWVDGEWYEYFPNDELRDKENNLLGICMDKAHEIVEESNYTIKIGNAEKGIKECDEFNRLRSVRCEQKIEKCIDVPYAEKVCVHKKIVGLKKK